MIKPKLIAIILLIIINLGCTKTNDTISDKKVSQAKLNKEVKSEVIEKTKFEIIKLNVVKGGFTTKALIKNTEGKSINGSFAFVFPVYAKDNLGNEYTCEDSTMLGRDDQGKQLGNDSKLIEYFFKPKLNPRSKSLDFKCILSPIPHNLKDTIIKKINRKNYKNKLNSDVVIENITVNNNGFE